MEFEAMDWEVEARRVARAFGVGVPVRFVPRGQTGQKTPAPFMWLHTVGEKPTCFVPISSVLCVMVSYHPRDRFSHGHGLRHFNVFRTGTMIEGNSRYQARIDLNWDGSVTSNFYALKQKLDAIMDRPWYYYRFARVLAKGLLNLDLLTPEIEAALRLNISGHEKMEWAWEFEARG